MITKKNQLIVGVDHRRHHQQDKVWQTLEDLLEIGLLLKM